MIKQKIIENEYHSMSYTDDFIKEVTRKVNKLGKEVLNIQYITRHDGTIHYAIVIYRT